MSKHIINVWCYSTKEWALSLACSFLPKSKQALITLLLIMSFALRAFTGTLISLLSWTWTTYLFSDIAFLFIMDHSITTLKHRLIALQASHIKKYAHRKCVHIFFYLLSYQCLYNYKSCYPIRIFSMFSSIYRQNKVTAYSTLLAAAFKKAILNLNLYRWPVTCISVNFFSNFIRGVQGKT